MTDRDTAELVRRHVARLSVEQRRAIIAEWDDFERDGTIGVFLTCCELIRGYPVKWTSQQVVLECRRQLKAEVLEAPVSGRRRVDCG